ncbi:GAF domain-containing protein [Flaviaesturariibacter amylovorans]|uniref:GAF domain-containing protein n=1 Tax=Flaviaesturariibacter amylovorans TaxID=1084520 RepID=A0ABP8HD79_9BACT
MTVSPKEQERIDALRRLDLLDSGAEAEFNDLVTLASDLCRAPISLLTLIDEDRQWFKAAVGMDLTETERSVAFCDKALLQDDIFVVADAASDARFAANPYVTGEPNIRFYAGALIHSPDGHKLGTLCIIDTQPRELSWKEASILGKLARQATNLIQLREQRRQTERLTRQVALLESEARTRSGHWSRLAHLSHLQNENLASFFDNGMDALVSGRFTKKELMEIGARAREHRAQVSRFNEALSFLDAVRSGRTGPAEPVRIPALMGELFEELAPLVRASGNQVSPFIPADLTLHEDPALVRFILCTLLGALLGAASRTPISFAAQPRNGGVEFLVNLPEQNLVDALQRFLPDTLTLGLEHLSGKPFPVELALVKDLIFARGGHKEVRRLGNRGTTIEVFLPSAQQHS